MVFYVFVLMNLLLESTGELNPSNSGKYFPPTMEIRKPKAVNIDTSRFFIKL